MLNIVRLWIVFSTALVAGGWILSALHALNRAGYAIILILALFAGVLCWKTTCYSQPFAWRSFWSRWIRRFSRPAPFIFLLIVVLNLAGGLADRPDNGDSNSYRVPRVLHWLGNQGWCWIHTGDSRMNIAGSGFEWLFAPQILFLRTDRWLFLVNLISYLLLPGLIFDLFRRLRIQARVAWWWMWLLAGGWCYVFQATSTLNDSLGVTYALASVVLALRAAETRAVADIWLSVLAAALLTGVKQTNLPLALPCLIALWPGRQLLWRNLGLTLAVTFLAILVSAVPQAILNFKYAGTWTGFPKEVTHQMFAWGQQQELTSPGWGLIGNLFCFPAQNLLPPFFPWATAWNNAMKHFLETGLGSHFGQFEVFGYLNRSITATNAGIGLAVICVITLSLLGIYRLRNASAAQQNRSKNIWLLWLQLTPWLCLLIFLAKVGTYQNARQAAPYYIFLFPSLLSATGHAMLVRRRWWQCVAISSLCVTVAYLSFARGRAFIPSTVVTQLQQEHPHAKWLTVFADYFSARNSVNSQRNFLQKCHVTNEKIVGYATTVGGSEPGWWMPFGSREVRRILPSDTEASVRQQGIHYIVVEDIAVHAANLTIEEWASRYDAEIVGEQAFTKDPNTPLAHLYLAHIRD